MPAAAKLKQGNVIVEIESSLLPPKAAGKMTVEQIRALPKCRPGIGLVCAAAASSIEQMGDEFTSPKGVTPAVLREFGARAEKIDHVITNLEQMLEQLKQANLLFDAQALELISKVNDQVKAQGKRNKQVAIAFAPVTEYFAASAPKKPKAK